MCKAQVNFSKHFTKTALTGGTQPIGSPMTSDEFRRRAANCLKWAQEATNERTKALWLNMAQVWLSRAQDPRCVDSERMQAFQLR
jgi:hypothetical protein